jgi:hypothetical protein
VPQDIRELKGRLGIWVQVEIQVIQELKELKERLEPQELKVTQVP